MSIGKLRKGKDENIISGIGENGESFLLLFGRLYPFSFFLSFFLSFYLIRNPNPHNPPIRLLSSKNNDNPFHNRQFTFK